MGQPVCSLVQLGVRQLLIFIDDRYGIGSLVHLHLEQLVQAGVFRSRAEAAAFLIDEGIKAQHELFGRVAQKLSEIERLRAELRGMIAKPE